VVGFQLIVDRRKFNLFYKTHPWNWVRRTPWISHIIHEIRRHLTVIRIPRNKRSLVNLRNPCIIYIYIYITYAYMLYEKRGFGRWIKYSKRTKVLTRGSSSSISKWTFRKRYGRSFITTILSKRIWLIAKNERRRSCMLFADVLSVIHCDNAPVAGRTTCVTVNY